MIRAAIAPKNVITLITKIVRARDAVRINVVHTRAVMIDVLVTAIIAVKIYAILIFQFD